jgi:hypothetical protein
MPALRAGFQDLLDALEGVSYALDPQGMFLAVGRPGWSQFATDNGQPALAEDRIIGRHLFDYVSGPEVQDIYRRMHEMVLSRTRPQITFQFRCDAPDAERRMRMSVSLISVEGEPAAILYQSQVLAEISRPPMDLFDPVAREAGLASMRNMPLINMCSYCHDVALTGDGPAGARQWITPEAYYRAGGSSQVRISHGICQECYETVGSPLKRVA